MKTLTGPEQPVVLLVEADSHLRRVISAYLERDGCRVFGVASLAAAVHTYRAIAAREVKLLILDLDDVDLRAVGLDLDALAFLPMLLLASGPLPPGSACLASPPLLRKPFHMGDLRQHVKAALRRDDAAAA